MSNLDALVGKQGCVRPSVVRYEADIGDLGYSMAARGITPHCRITDRKVPQRVADTEGVTSRKLKL